MLRLAVMEANVFRFSVAKASTLAKELSVVARKSETFNDFRKSAESISEVYNRRYLQTEYNYAQAVGQNGAKYNRQIREKDVFPYVQYKTIGDSRVRDAHRILHDKVFEVGSNAHDVVQCPNGWGCRCELVQITASDLEGKKPVDVDGVKRMLQSVKINQEGATEWDYMQKNGFTVNRAKIGEIFREADFYTQGKK